VTLDTSRLFPTTKAPPFYIHVDPRIVDRCRKDQLYSLDVSRSKHLVEYLSYQRHCVHNQNVIVLHVLKPNIWTLILRPDTLVERQVCSSFLSGIGTSLLGPADSPYQNDPRLHWLLGKSRLQHAFCYRYMIYDHTYSCSVISSANGPFAWCRTKKAQCAFLTRANLRIPRSTT
jgi:hypothetical protein